MQDWLLPIFSSHVNHNILNSSSESIKCAQPAHHQPDKHTIELAKSYQHDQHTIEPAKSYQPVASYIKYLRMFRPN